MGADNAAGGGNNTELCAKEYTTENTSPASSSLSASPGIDQRERADLKAPQPPSTPHGDRAHGQRARRTAPASTAPRRFVHDNFLAKGFVPDAARRRAVRAKLFAESCVQTSDKNCKKVVATDFDVSRAAQNLPPKVRT